MHMLADIIGLVGVVIILIAYGLLQLDLMSPDGVSFSLLNCVGSILIIVSLLNDWNTPAFVMEIAWLVISIFGLIKGFVLRSRY